MARSQASINLNTVFGRLSLVEEAKPKVFPNGQKARYFVCKCECGNVKTIQLRHLKSGNTTSCGCYNAEIHTKHKCWNTPLYKAYYNMKDRCYRENHKYYRYYGGKGIKVCSMWLGTSGFINFKKWNDSLPKNEQFQEGLELDRKNSKNNYTPSNCKWSTKIENILNRDSTLEVTHKGITYKFVDFYNKYNKNNVKYSTAISRYSQYKWDAMKAVTHKVPR